MMPPENQQGFHQESGQPKETVKEIHHHHYDDGRPHGYFGRLFWGLLIIFIGLLFLAQNSGWVVGIDLGALLAKIWPLFIGFLGLSILSRGGWIGGIITGLGTLLVFGLLFFAIFGSTPTSSEVTTKTFTVPKEAGVQGSEVSIKAGAGKLTIHGGGSDVVSGSLQTNFLEMHTFSNVESGVQKVRLESDNTFHFFSLRNVNNLDMAVNNDLPIKLDIDAGASDVQIDLSDVPVQLLNLNSGASNINISLGDKFAASAVVIRAGASALHIKVPKDVGARLSVDTGLSSKNFTDFKQIDSRTYESNNYATAAKKIDITIDAGASSLNVDWR